MREGTHVRPGVSQIILAAGESRRMGRPKANLRFGCETALSIAIRNGRAAGVDEIIIILGDQAREILAAHGLRGPGDLGDGLSSPAGDLPARAAGDLGEAAPSPAGVLPAGAPRPRIVINPAARAGRSGSLKVGLRALAPGAEGFLIYPVDFPLVLPSDVISLVDAFARPPNRGSLIFIPSHEMRRGHPVLCRTSLVDEFLALGDDTPAREVIRRHEDAIHHVGTDHPGVCRDVDTPDDYERALALYLERESPHGFPMRGLRE